MKTTAPDTTKIMLFYESFEDAIGDVYDMDKAASADLYRAVVRYGLYGEEPQLTGICATLWKLMLPTLVNGRNKALAGKKGGKATKHNNPNGRRGKTDTADDSEPSDTPKKPQGKAAARFTPPSVDEVQQYITAQGYAVNAAKFVDYYTVKGWTVGNAIMKDWKAAVRLWQSRLQPQPSPYTPNERGEVNVCGTIVELGYDEWIDAAGRRTYGDGKTEVPKDAPRRPAECYVWSRACNEWVFNTY